MSQLTVIAPRDKMFYNLTTNNNFDTLAIHGDDLEISDGHHTFTELYEHRYALFCALTKVYDNYITPIGHRVRCWKSKLHNDGTSYEGWFIAGITFKDVKMNEYQISYHIPNDWWNRFNLFELERAPKWDGHNSNDVIARLLML